MSDEKIKGRSAESLARDRVRAAVGCGLSQRVCKRREQIIG